MYVGTKDVGYEQAKKVILELLGDLFKDFFHMSTSSPVRLTMPL